MKSFGLLVLVLSAVFGLVQHTRTQSPKDTVLQKSTDERGADSVSEISKLVLQLGKRVEKTPRETENNYISRIRSLTTKTVNPRTKKSLSDTFLILNLKPQYSDEEQQIFFDLSDLDESSKVVLASRDHFDDVMDWMSLTYSDRVPTLQRTFKTAYDLIPNLRLAVKGFPIAVAKGKLWIVPTKYCILDIRNGNKLVETDAAEVF